MTKANIKCNFSIKKAHDFLRNLSLYPKHKILAYVFTLVLQIFLLSNSTSPAMSQSSGEGTLGWCAAIGQHDECTYGSSAVAACHIAMAAFNPDATFMGAEMGDNWNVAACKWCKYNADGIGCFGIAAPTVTFYCSGGYHPVPPSNCVKDNDPDVQPRACSESGGKSIPRTSNPVVLLTGSKYFRHTDFTFQQNSLSLSRIYSNKRTVGQTYYSIASLGAGWLYDFQLYLFLPNYFWTYAAFSLMLPDGSAVNFKRGNDGSVLATGDPGTPGGYSPDYGIRFLDTWPSDLGTVPSVKSHWELKDPEGTTWLLETFNNNYSSGGNPSYQIARPVSRTKKSGQKTTFSYDLHGQLLSIKDDFNNTIMFDWYTQSITDQNNSSLKYDRPLAIKTARIFDGSTVNYTYKPQDGFQFNSFDNLSKVERFDNSGKSVYLLLYNSEDARYPSYITSVVDGRGVKTNQIIYDDRGRVIKSSLANSTDSSDIVYSELQSDNTINRTVTNALGKQTVYTYRRNFNNYLFSTKNGLASTNCTAGVSTQNLDSNGFVSSDIDEEGRKTTYVRDILGRPTRITKGPS